MDRLIVKSKPRYWDEASHYLIRRDRILKRLIPRHSDEWLEASPTAFQALARIIISQQLSVTSANALWQKFLTTCEDQALPDKVQALIRQGGLSCLSSRKRDYIASLAAMFSDHWHDQPPQWADMDNEAVIHTLEKIRGVGRWSAEMFLIFYLRRPDILPLDDTSLLKAISVNYFSGEPVSRFEAREVAQAWAPWRTVAAWHLWRNFDPAAVQF